MLGTRTMLLQSCAKEDSHDCKDITGLYRKSMVANSYLDRASKSIETRPLLRF